jgi:serine/threonine protein phosphatase PrpC
MIMQAQANILQRIAQVYVARRGVRVLCVLGVLSAGGLLALLSGGFPPYAWRLLAQTLPRISALEAAHGPVVLLALAGLILLSLTLLIAWCALLWLCWRMLAYWRYERRELRRFAEDAAEAQYLAEDDNVARAPHYSPGKAFAKDNGASALQRQARSVREPRYAPLASYSRYPLALEEPDEDDSYPDGQGYEDEEEDLGEYQDEEPGVPQDEEEEDGEQSSAAHRPRVYGAPAFASGTPMPAAIRVQHIRPSLLAAHARGTVPVTSSEDPVHGAPAPEPGADRQRVDAALFHAQSIKPSVLGEPAQEHDATPALSSYTGADQRAQGAPLAQEQRGSMHSASGVSTVPTQPMRSAQLKNVADAPATYDQQIVEHVATEASVEQLHHSSYGRIVPFVPPANWHPHPPTGYYSRVHLAPSNMSTTPSVTRRPTTRLIVSTGLDVGLKRKDRPNEDSLLALQNTRVLRGNTCPVGLFVVADGMGGHTNGQEASRLVIQTLSKTVVPSIIYGPTDDNYAELLAEGVHHANLEVYRRNRQEKANMGTTIAAALVVDTTAYVVSAGDSRVYLYRASSGLSQVTRDHSIVARLVENGLIPPEDIYTHPRRNEIYRSLGHQPSEDLDRFILALQPEDILLLCSDGLWEMVRDNQIEQIIASTLHRPTQISAALVQAALEGGGKDNISVIVVYVKAEEEAQATWAAG